VLPVPLIGVVQWYPSAIYWQRRRTEIAFAELNQSGHTDDFKVPPRFLPNLADTSAGDIPLVRHGSCKIGVECRLAKPRHIQHPSPQVHLLPIQANHTNECIHTLALPTAVYIPVLADKIAAQPVCPSMRTVSSGPEAQAQVA
jgi:hypothetical protein